MGASLVGFAIGRKGGPLLARLAPPKERGVSERFLNTWGAAALVVTRPVPLLAETVAVLAGTSSMTWKMAAGAALAGAIPGAFLYAMAGAAAATSSSGILIFTLVIAVSGLFWFVGRCIVRCQKGGVTDVD
jgi:uncharacterized membrane protein YdjX (TVP38/TMEM64 family)